MSARRRRRNIFSSLRVIGLFLVGMGVAFVVALNHLDLENLRSSVLDVLHDSTGAPVEIDGAVSWKLSLRPVIELNKVRVPNSDGKCRNVFSAEKIDVRINLLSLFQSRPTIQKIKIYDANVCVEKNESSSKNNEPDADVLKTEHATGKTPLKYPFTDPGLVA